MDVSGQTVHLGHFTAREIAGFGGCEGTVPGLDIFKNRYFCCSFQDLNPRFSGIYPGHFTDYTTAY